MKDVLQISQMQASSMQALVSRYSLVQVKLKDVMRLRN